MNKKPKAPQVKIVPRALATFAEMVTAFIELRSAAIALKSLVAQRQQEKDEVTAAIDAKYADKISCCELAIKQHSADLTRWALSNRAEFGKLRSLETVAGWLKFRTGTPALKLALKSWDKVLERITAFGLESLYIRNKPEVNKEALLNDRDASLVARGGKKIKIADLGVKAVQEERFSIAIKEDDVPEPQEIIDVEVEADLSALASAKAETKPAEVKAA